MKTLGPKFGSNLKQVQAAIASASPSDLTVKIGAGQPFELSGFTLEPADLMVQFKGPEGWAGVADRGTEVLLDTRITEELAHEGMAREVVRFVQDLRKKSNLEMEDRISLQLSTDSAALGQAIETHREYIAGETLTREWATLSGSGFIASVKVEGQPLTIELKRWVSLRPGLDLRGERS